MHLSKILRSPKGERKCFNRLWNRLWTSWSGILPPLAPLVVPQERNVYCNDWPRKRRLLLSSEPRRGTSMARFRAFFKLGELEKLLEAHPRLSKMEKILVEKHGFTEGNARRYMARVLRTIIDDFGESYFADMSKHLDRIGELRSKLSDIYEAIREGKGVPEHVETGSVNDLFAELDKEMKALQSPQGAASKAGKAHYSNDTLARAAEEAKAPAPVPPEITAAAIKRALEKQTEALSHLGAARSALEKQTEALSHLDTATQRIVRDVARRAPDEVGKAIRAETQGGLTRALKELTDRLRKEGKKEDEIARLQNGIEEMNKA